MALVKELLEETAAYLDRIIEALTPERDTNHPETILWFDDGTSSSYNWSGEINEQTMVDAGLSIFGSWTKTIVKAEIGSDVTSIGEDAFSGCSGLMTMTIGNGVTSIMDYAFSNCSGLTSVTIPDSVTSIGNTAFDGCVSLTALIFKDKTFLQVQKMDGYSWNINPEYIYPNS